MRPLVAFDAAFLHCFVAPSLVSFAADGCRADETADTSFFSENFLLTPPVAGAFEGVKALVRRYCERVEANHCQLLALPPRPSMVIPPPLMVLQPFSAPLPLHLYRWIAMALKRFIWSAKLVH